MMRAEDEHKKMVANLKKSGSMIAGELTGSQADLLHMGVGVAGESGELLDAIKKHTIYQKDIDAIQKDGMSIRENIIEELGDLEFYLEGVRQNLGLSREETLEHNLDKLLKGDRARYKDGKYSDEAAHDRADKQAVG